MSPVLGTQLIHRCHERIELYTLTRVRKAPVRSSVPRTLESTFLQCAPAGDAWESTEALADSKDCALFSIMNSAVVYNSISRAIRVSVCLCRHFQSVPGRASAGTWKIRKQTQRRMQGLCWHRWLGCLIGWGFFLILFCSLSDEAIHFAFPEWGQYFLNDPIHIPLSPFHS